MRYFKHSFKAFDRFHDTGVPTDKKGFASTWQWWVLKLFPHIERSLCVGCALPSVTSGGATWIYLCSRLDVGLSAKVVMGQRLDSISEVFSNISNSVVIIKIYASTRLWLGGFTCMIPKGQPNSFTLNYLTLKKHYWILTTENLFLVLPCWNNQAIRELNKQLGAKLKESVLGSRVEVVTKTNHSVALVAAALDQNQRKIYARTSPSLLFK